MSVEKRVKYDVQGGVKNYLGKQKEVKAPLKWQSSPDHPTTELAYITKAEKDLLVKQDLHGSLKGGVNRGPSGIMSLNGWGSADESQNVSGAAASAAESGRNTSDTLAEGMSAQDVRDFQAAAVASGAGQRVNPGFFDSRNTVDPDVLARAKAFNPDAFSAGRRGGIMDFFTGGGILGSIVRGLGQKLGFGKTFDQPTYDMSRFSGLPLSGSTAFQNLDIRDKFDRRFQNVDTRSKTLDEFGYSPSFLSSLVDEFGVNNIDKFGNTVGPVPSGGITNVPLDTSQDQSKDDFFKDAMVDASKDQNREILENLFNPALNFDKALDKKEKEKKRQQELLKELMLT